MAIAIGLLKTLLELTRSRKSGALSITGGGTRARVFVEEGTIVYADEGTIGETLGRILVREKVLTDEQYNAALERMEARTKKGVRAKLGEILIELRFLTPVQLDAALSAQVRQKVIRAIGWGSSTFRFMECHGALDIAARFATPLEPLVLAALRLAEEEHVEELLDLALTRYPELRGDGSPTGGAIRKDTLRRVAAFEMQPAEHDFAMALDGSRTSADILASTSEVNPTVVLALLLLTDCLDLHASAKTPRSAPPPSSTPAADKPKPRPLRGITPVAGAKPGRPIAIAKKTAQRPPGKKAPSSVRPPAASDLEQTRSVAARLKQASEAKKSLPPPASDEPVETPIPSAPKVGELALWTGESGGPSTPMAPVNRILAEKAFQAGKAFVRANNMKDAAVELARAATLFPAIEYELWAKWTAMRADKAGEAKHVPAVKALAEKAIEQDPSLGFAYFVLGHLALLGKDAARARELFAKARALDPAASSEAKDVRLKDKDETSGAAAQQNAETQRTSAPEIEAPPPSSAKPRAAEDEAPATRPSVAEPAPVAADAPRSSKRGAEKPMSRRNMVIGVGAAAVVAVIATIAATRKDDAKPHGTAPSAVEAAAPLPTPSASPATSPATSVPAPTASASSDPNEISLDDEDAASDAGASDAASAPDTK